jgi:hypothetical protein
MCPYVIDIGINIRFIVRMSRAAPARLLILRLEGGEYWKFSKMISYGSYYCATAVLCSVLQLVMRKMVCMFITDLFVSVTRLNCIGNALSSNVGGNTHIGGRFS